MVTTGLALRRLIAIALAVMLGVATLILLAKSVQNSSDFGRLQSTILWLNLGGVALLSILLGRKVWQLVRDYREHVPGSRLTARTVAIFGSLVIAPLLIVYLFSLEFLNRGIDSWFREDVRQELNDALSLSRSQLNSRAREYSQRTEKLAEILALTPGEQYVSKLEEARKQVAAREIILFGTQGRILGLSVDAELAGVPLTKPSAELLRQISQKQVYMAAEPQVSGRYLIHTAAALNADVVATDARFVMAIYRLPDDYAQLAEAVQRAYSQYGDLAALRTPLKNSFQLTLTLVLLLAMLAAIHGAIFSAQRLIRPVQDLIAGTRAVGKGDFATRLMLPSHDEMGFLVHSFNDMTKRLRRAHDEAQRSQEVVEQERARLAIILGRLSTGVLALDRDLSLRMANRAATLILKTNFESYVGQSLTALAANNDLLRQFIKFITGRLGTGVEEWREQIKLDTPEIPITLMCACTPLIAEGSDVSYIVVFEDITALLQAQRDAAWGEVARRLAHEIKNPLTPIRLSAERMRKRFLSNMSAQDAEILERATRTIVQQVETMQDMVNAFSQYARAPQLQLKAVAFNALVIEVVDFFRSLDKRAVINLILDQKIGSITADSHRLRQLLNNLLTNAFEAAPHASVQVTIETRLEHANGGEWVNLTISDNGPGFPRELLPHVFEPYVTSKAKGTGLGLAIVKKIVEEHSGRIEVQNCPQGGASVRVVLPIQEPA
jgi:nitrogen fixation/metabolism regulation signal transduction histidine kinase